MKGRRSGGRGERGERVSKAKSLTKGYIERERVRARDRARACDEPGNEYWRGDFVRFRARSSSVFFAVVTVGDQRVVDEQVQRQKWESGVLARVLVFVSGGVVRMTHKLTYVPCHLPLRGKQNTKQPLLLIVI